MPQVLLMYAAGAWVGVEIIGFLAETYQWPRKSVDLAVLLAVAGAGVTITLSWYHGPRGRQAIVRSEVVILSALLLATLATGAAIILRSPAATFAKLSGHRLIIEFPLLELNEMRFSFSPQNAGAMTPTGAVVLEPENVTFELPGLSFTSLGAPVQVLVSELANPRAIIVLPGVPEPLKSPPVAMSESMPLRLATLLLVLEITRSASSESFTDSTVIKLDEGSGL